MPTEAPVSFAGLENQDLIEALLQAIRSRCISGLASAIDAYPDPVTMSTAFNSVARTLYRQDKDVSNMLVAGDTGLAYCLKKSAVESDKDRARELKKLARIIAFNTAANCWPGWGDAGIVIAKSHISAAIELAAKCRDLSQELAQAPRERGGAHWLVGALELAAGRFSAARSAFEEAERVYGSDEALSSYVLMARGYIALAQKAEPQSHMANAEALNKALEQLRFEGSKDAIFFAEQIATADRLLFAK